MKKEKKIFLVNLPSQNEAYGSLKDFVAISPPLGLINIAAVLEKAGYEVALCDGEVENISLEETIQKVIQAKADFIGFTTMTATMEITDDFIKRIKKLLPKLITIIGGPHVSALPRKTLLENHSIDFAIIGEGDDSIIELLNAINNNSKIAEIKGIVYREDKNVIFTGARHSPDLAKLPMPAYHLLKNELYKAYGWNGWNGGERQPLGAVCTSRGCFGKCNFCATSCVFGNKIKYYPVERVKREIDFLVNECNIKVLYFLDDVFTANRKILNIICDYIIEKGYGKKLSFTVSSRVDIISEQSLKKMREAGIDWLAFGVESGNQEILTKMGKNITIEQTRKAFKLANEAGFSTMGNFMIGHIGETYETAMDTINLACELDMDYASFAVAIPLPGTKLYDYCIENSIPLPSWKEYGSVNSPPIALNASLDAKELMELRRLATNKFFKRPGYFIKLLLKYKKTTIIKDFVKMYFALQKTIKKGNY